MQITLGKGYVVRNIHNGKFAIVIESASRLSQAPPRVNFTRDIDCATIFKESNKVELCKRNGINASNFENCEFIAATAHRHVSFDEAD